MRKIIGLLLALAVAGCGVSNGNHPTPPASSSASPSATPSASQPSATQSAPTAYDQLAGFVQAAELLDAQLHHAATLINSAGPPWSDPVPSAVTTAVEAAQLGAVAREIPAGLPDALLRRTILVYSDLVSRRDAMRWFGREGLPTAESSAKQQAELLKALGHGSAAAARFNADLQGLIAAARTAAPVTIAAAASRESAELMLLVKYVDGINGGCESTGGTVVTNLPTITWNSAGTGGKIGGVGFEAYQVDGVWRVNLLAC